MTWSIVDKKIDEFKIFGVAVAVAIIMVTFVLLSFLSVLLFVSYLE